MTMRGKDTTLTPPPTPTEATTTPAPQTAAASTDEAAKRARLAELDRLIAEQEARLTRAATTTPPPAPAVPEEFQFTNDMSVEQVEALERGQEAMVRQLQRDFAQIESHQLMQWTGMPDWMRPPRAHFFRCGLRGPGKEGQRTAQIKARMLQAGWKPAPRGTRCALYATDGDQGEYVFLMHEAWMVHKEIQNSMAAEQQRRNEGRRSRANASLLETRGLNIERFDVETRTGSMGDFREDTRGRRS